MILLSFSCAKQEDKVIKELLKKANKETNALDYSKAEKTYIKISKMDPDNPVYYFMIGSLQVQLKKETEAQLNFKQHIDILSKRESITSNEYPQLITSYICVDDYEKALSTAEEAIKSFPKDQTIKQFTESTPKFIEGRKKKKARINQP